MSVQTLITPKKEIRPTIYAYTTPTNTAKEGWVKIGYTERDVDTRIKEQSGTIGLATEKLWNYEARFNGGGYFKDHDFHTFLMKNGVKREPNSEWFYFNGDPERAQVLYQNFAFQEEATNFNSVKAPYQLRQEQMDAVDKTLHYAKNYPQGEFLWNAKPRFGKTLTTYDFARKLDAVNVLIVTNRPAIANSWYDDYEKFIAWQTDFKFVSESDSLKDRPTMSQKEFGDYATIKTDKARRIVFVSLQDLKGSIYFGGSGEKLDWIAKSHWDLLVIDEAHEGVDTFKTDVALDNLKRKFTLHLSGTPFKAIAKEKFSENQIFNWSYEDEQEAKNNWHELTNNPYEGLPRLNLFTYQMSLMITEAVNQGVQINGETKEYAFDLNEFFSTKENGDFVYEKEIWKWLNTLTENEKYPFSTPTLRNELKHTLWLLERVASAKALAKLLKNHPVFENYEIILAAGNGKKEEEESKDVKANETSYNKVKAAIKAYDKTITLSVGQLTTGVTIPEWTAVMMLSNLKSPALYMQAAFRSQNSHTWEAEGKYYRKENAYVFDFAPERTLMIFDDFANHLSTKTTAGGGTTENRNQNITRLLNFFPVIAEDQAGEMILLDAAQVLTIPRMIKANEVVRRGFMSNLLFANISGIFQAPQVALDILNQLQTEALGKVKKENRKVDTQGIEVDDLGEAIPPNEIVINQTAAIFGEKVVELDLIVANNLEGAVGVSDEKLMKEITKTVITTLAPEIKKVQATYDLTNNGISQVNRQLESNVQETVEKSFVAYNISKAHLNNRFTNQFQVAETSEEKQEIETNWQKELEQSLMNHNAMIQAQVAETIEKTKIEIVEKQEKARLTKEKKSVEDEVRGRLRGFSRTIPSFIMAYGDEGLTLANFNDYTPANVFKEVTGITVEQFIFLRDGGTYEEEGINQHFTGNLFDEVVFNESVQEFLRKKKLLSNYFEVLEEDIFDYIPPQKTNQIYTPKNVVIRMIKTLEEENPGIYDDSNKTFIDFYMKSGLYITEIVKRLYTSEIIRQEYPDDNQRIQHILENQVYGFAPSEIIYQIATKFIFGDLDAEISRRNFVQEDTVPYAKKGILQDLIDSSFPEGK